ICFSGKVTPGDVWDGSAITLCNTRPMTSERIMGLIAATPMMFRSMSAIAAMAAVSTTPGRRDKMLAKKGAAAGAGWVSEGCVTGVLLNVQDLFALERLINPTDIYSRNVRFFRTKAYF